MPVKPSADTPEEDARHARRRRARSGQGPIGTATGIANDADVTAAALGRKVRELRQAARLSATELARRANVSQGMISQIESGQATPSISTLVGIARALDARVADFFDDHVEPGRVVRKSERHIIDYPAIGVRDEMISSDPTGKLQVLVAHIEGGRGSGNEPFVHGSEAECVLVLEGQLTILLGEQEVDLAEGDCLTFSGDVPHGFVNKGTATARVIWIITPVSY